MSLWQRLEEKLKAAVAPKELFNDQIHVHTTNSGTQYISSHDVFSDKQAMEEMRQLSATVRARQSEATSPASNQGKAK